MNKEEAEFSTPLYSDFGVTSNNDAAQLAEIFSEEECPTKVVGVPVTLNGDLKNQYVETNVGYDTICKVLFYSTYVMAGFKESLVLEDFCSNHIIKATFARSSRGRIEKVQLSMIDLSPKFIEEHHLRWTKIVARLNLRRVRSASGCSPCCEGGEAYTSIGEVFGFVVRHLGKRRTPQTFLLKWAYFSPKDRPKSF
ncbi:hypothetical protein G4B88_003181 [Cannabis sativa]|uniref:Uncharacterized protein n=1 Tax=Cannabis sativa TaxID=3483 RepID=A0A7J6DJ35_CANSA|nr:hypothetical protein G4B88_003181 [Cannabis sativa]